MKYIIAGISSLLLIVNLSVASIITAEELMNARLYSDNKIESTEEVTTGVTTAEIETKTMKAVYVGDGWIEDGTGAIQITIPENSNLEDLKIGDTLEVEYTGNIVYTQIHNLNGKVISVKKLDEANSFIIINGIIKEIEVIDEGDYYSSTHYLVEDDNGVQYTMSTSTARYNMLNPQIGQKYTFANKFISDGIYYSSNIARYTEEISQTIVLGDLDFDNSIDNKDLVFMCRVLIKEVDLSDELIKKADLNKDGYFDIADVAMEKQIILGDKL